MATNWMRWNDTTHVFEKSTDGVTFVPVPINASCISEGTLPPAVIPGGGNAPDLAGNNVFTGLNTFSGVQPTIRFTETDGGVNQKNWEIAEISSVLYLGRTINDALAGPVNLFSIDRGGNITVNAVTSASHGFNANVDGGNQIHFVNTSVGVSAYAGLMFQNSGGDGRGYLIFTGGGNTNASFTPDALVLYSGGLGGILVNAGAAAPITFRTTNSVRLTISSAGVITTTGAMTVGGALTCASATVNAGLVVSGTGSFGGTLTCNAINCAAINTQNNSITMGTGDLSCGAIAASEGLGVGVAAVTISAANSTVALGTASILRVNATAAGCSLQTITGGVQGRVCFVVGVGQYFTLSTGGNINVASGSIIGCVLIYETSFWRVVSLG